MAKKYDSQFLIIEGTGSEFVAAGMGGGEVKEGGIVHGGVFDGFSLVSIEGDDLVCDTCNKGIGDNETAYYVAVLNRLLCKECFEDWIANAEYYPEDADIEKSNFDYYYPNMLHS